MGAYEDLTERLKQTEVVQQVLSALEEEPVALLQAICGEYAVSNEPVPDHHLPISGYLKEVALRTLLSAGLLQREPGGRLSIYAYRPTAEGMKYYKKLLKDGWSRRQ
ncbi:MAG TPA: hypothetical protein G4O13_07525 [Dehalococcoidia bacterium]|nr:hypothetical protein [Dehalococcoidia bacterium]